MRAVTIRIASALAALATATVVSSCSHPVHDVHEHNAADVAFAQNMIPHHQQAVDMSAMAPTHTANPDVIVIAKHISLDQQAEIEVLQESARAVGRAGCVRAHRAWRARRNGYRRHGGHSHHYPAASR